jgi:AraC family transcriptional regulator
MNSHSHLNREAHYPDLQSAETWSDRVGHYVEVLDHSVEETKGQEGGKRYAVPIVGARSLSTGAAMFDRISQAEKRGSVMIQPSPSSKSIGRIEFAAEAATLLDDVRRAMERNPEVAREIALRLVTVLTLPAVSKSPGFRGGLAPCQMRKVDRYMREYIESPLHIKTLAEQVALSASHFCRAFKESYGTTPHMHVVRLRVELAQRLMLTTDEPLCQIALACGLADQACLSKLFRRRVGETPNAWRRQNLTDAQVEARSRRSKESHFVSSGLRSEHNGSQL